MVFLFALLFVVYITTGSNKTCTEKEDCVSSPYRDCYYHDYLHLDKILNSNTPRSGEYLAEIAHDEHLFITIHQAYELWFKQILYELESCITHLTSDDVLSNHEILVVVHRFKRINVILKLLVEQWSVLETMTPLDYLDFRKYLKPASGFQSVQFRILENTLGLDEKKRMRYRDQDYTNVLSEEHKNKVRDRYNTTKTLFHVIQDWLQRFPYLEGDENENWSFWKEYKSAVNEYVLGEEEFYKGRPDIDPLNIETFNVIFDENKYESFIKKGAIRLSYKSFQAALMIMLYRDEPLLQMPFRVISRLMDMDNLLTQWRNKHALIVHNMIGSKMGTGGSSGYGYLKTAVTHHTIFDDFFKLSTYMIPKSYLPELPNSLKSLMRFPKTARK